MKIEDLKIVWTLDTNKNTRKKLEKYQVEIYRTPKIKYVLKAQSRKCEEFVICTMA